MPTPAILRRPPRPVLLAAACALFLVACGDSPPASKRPTTFEPIELPTAPLSDIRVRPVEPLPEGAPGVGERIDFGVELLERGDIWQVKWASALLGRIGEPAVDPLAKAMLEKLPTNPEFVRNALFVFGRDLPAPGAVPAIEEVVRGPDPSLRRDAAKALGNTRSEKAIGPLLRLVGADDFAVAGAALEEYGRLPAVPAARALREAFPEGVNEAMRMRAVTEIGKSLPPEEAGPFLLRLTKADAPEIAVGAAAALARIGRPEGRKILLELLEAGLPRALEIHALAPLAEEGNPAALPRLLEIAREPLVPGGLQAVNLLGEYHVEEAWNLLRGLAGSGLDDAVRSDALYQLVRAGAPDARELLRDRLASEDPEDRTLAAFVYPRLDEPEAAKAVAAAVRTEEDPEVRAQLLKALAILARPEGQEAALAALEEEKEPIPSKATLAVNAAAALLAMPELSDAVLSRLAGLAREGIPSVRIQAATVLGRHGTSAEARAALASMFESDYPDVRMAAAHAWLTFPDVPVKPLLEMAEDEPSRVRSRELVDLARMIRHR